MYEIVFDQLLWGERVIYVAALLPLSDPCLIVSFHPRKLKSRDMSIVAKGVKAKAILYYVSIASLHVIDDIQP